MFYSLQIWKLSSIKKIPSIIAKKEHSRLFHCCFEMLEHYLTETLYSN